jgi:hypothetical protein
MVNLKKERRTIPEIEGGVGGMEIRVIRLVRVLYHQYYQPKS